jgi:ribosomal protein L37AE/L43A
MNEVGFKTFSSCSGMHGNRTVGHIEVEASFSLMEKIALKVENWQFTYYCGPKAGRWHMNYGLPTKQVWEELEHVIRTQRPGKYCPKCDHPAQPIVKDERSKDPPIYWWCRDCESKCNEWVWVNGE